MDRTRRSCEQRVQVSHNKIGPNELEKKGAREASERIL